MERPAPLSRGRSAVLDRDREHARARYAGDRWNHNGYTRDHYYWRNAYRRGYSHGWYDAWRRTPYPRWYPGRFGVWIEVVYVRSPDRWQYGARAVSCSLVGDELEYAHDEWHWRNDRYSYERWYDREHRRLLRALDREWARSGCGYAPAFGSRCYARDWAPLRTTARVIVAMEILDILFDGDWHH